MSPESSLEKENPKVCDCFFGVQWERGEIFSSPPRHRELENKNRLCSKTYGIVTAMKDMKQKRYPTPKLIYEAEVKQQKKTFYGSHPKVNSLTAV